MPLDDEGIDMITISSRPARLMDDTLTSWPGTVVVRRSRRACTLGVVHAALACASFEMLMSGTQEWDDSTQTPATHFKSACAEGPLSLRRGKTV